MVAADIALHSDEKRPNSLFNFLGSNSIMT